MDTTTHASEVTSRLIDAVMLALDKIALRELASRSTTTTVEQACAAVHARAAEAMHHNPDIADKLEPCLSLLLGYLRQHAGAGQRLPDTDWGPLGGRSGD